MDNHNIIRSGNENLTGKVHSAACPLGFCDCCGNIKASLVVFGIFAAALEDMQVAHRVIMALLLVSAVKSVLAELLRLGYPAVCDKLAYFSEVFLRLGVVSVAEAARPDAVLVHLDKFIVRSAEYHTADASVSDGQGFVPVCGRCFIP